jgi:GT2 family glycosyltransferase
MSLIEIVGRNFINQQSPDIALSIIIPVYNKFNFTRNCLEDLFQLGPNHEIIVVDDCSSDETSAELKKLNRVNFKVIRNETNSGFAKSCDAGFQASRGTNVMFLNNDIRVQSNHSNWTDIILKEMTEDVLMGPTGGLLNVGNQFAFLYETNNPQKPINFMSGWCISATRKTFDKLVIDNSKPFCEDFFAYYEDADLSFRGTQLGIKFKMIDIPVIHFGKITSSQLNTGKLYSESRQTFIKKWQGKWNY